MMSTSQSSSVKHGENIRITVAANQGGRKYMEDRVNIETFRNSDGTIKFTFLGVYDGHGGYEASEYVRKNLLANIMACESFDSDDDDDILDAIKEGFLATHEEMAKVVGTWPRTASGYASTAGTTASVAIIRNGKVYTGHVGDSAIIMGTYKTRENKLVYEAERLTVDHKPEALDEQARIELAGGKVAQKSGVARVVWTRPIRGHIGPIRRSTPTESIPFLAVARSLGDLWSFCEATQQYVVSPEPDLAVRELTDDESCIILVSDGITNVLSHQQIGHLAELEERKLCTERKELHDLHEKQPNHARIIIAEAMKRWGHLRADNLSAIVVMFDPIETSLDAYAPFVDEDLDTNQSIDEMFLMDPECMLHITPAKAQKLWTERVPLLYEGALDNNFTTVDYRGPGFLTHDEEEDIETRLMVRQQLRESFRSERPIEKDNELDNTVCDNNHDATEDRQPSPSAKENLDVTPTKIAKFESAEDDSDDRNSDEEEPTRESPVAELQSASNLRTPSTRRSAKRIVEVSPAEGTSDRKIAIASRRMSLVKADTNAGTVIAFTGVVTRSRSEGVPEVFSTPTVSSSACARLSTPSSSHLGKTGSRKRPSRMLNIPESAGVTPFVERLRLECSPEKRDDEPVVRSEPSTPAKCAESPMRASKWSLSKLNQLRATTEEVAEPPSKIRRIYGFMKRLVGFSSN